ncbi:MAG: sugar phosphate isomerase/epimerase family protein [Planctomycetota bacterium]
MLAAVNAWTFPKLATAEEQIRAAAAAGFAGIELTVGAQEPLRPDTPPSAFRELARCAAAAGIQITGVATGLFWEYNYAAPDPAGRERARELTLRLLDDAAAAGAGAVLVVPAVVGCWSEPRPQVSYADALHRTLEALDELRFEAEARAITLAVENVWNRFLLSPVEAADLIDRVNSPYVGFYLDTGNTLAFGYPEDWIRTLGGRIVRVHAKDYDLRRPGADGFCPLGEGSVDWAAVMQALAEVGYDGPLTYEGGADPAEMCRRLNNILAGRPARAAR